MLIRRVVHLSVQQVNRWRLPVSVHFGWRCMVCIGFQIPSQVVAVHRFAPALRTETCAARFGRQHPGFNKIKLGSNARLTDVCTIGRRSALSVKLEIDVVCFSYTCLCKLYVSGFSWQKPVRAQPLSDALQKQCHTLSGCGVSLSL